MTIRVSYENTETGQSESTELPDGDWIVLCGKSSDIIEAMFHGIGSRNGIMREFRAWELAGQAFDGLCEQPLAFGPITEAQREEAHMAIVKATLTLADYMTHALRGLPKERQEQARQLAIDLGLLEP